MHQKSDFGWGSSSAPPDPLAGFGGPTSKGREGKGRRREGNGRREERESGGRLLFQTFLGPVLKSI